MRNRGLFLIASMILALSACGSAKIEGTKNLVVMEQVDSICGNNEENAHQQAMFKVDAPVDGPRALVDSVMAFVNKELYIACESNAHFDEDITTFSEKDVFTDDGERLLGHYMDKYRKFIEDSLWRVFGLELKLEAQTPKYVTYGLEHFHCGASCSLAKYYFIFDKKDGHLVNEIISHDNLGRFFEDYPEYDNIGADPSMDYSGWVFSSEVVFENSKCGLLGDHFSLVIPFGKFYQNADFPYSQIFSYLTPEVQSLLEQNGEDEPMLPAYLPERSEDGEVWMKVDTVKHELRGYFRAAGGPHVSTLLHYEPELEVYPKRVHSIDTGESTVFLFIYSRGHLLYCDEAMTCVFNADDKFQPVKLFPVEGEMNSVISCMWSDQLVEASDGFPFEEVDENRFGIHYDRFSKRLYIPVMEQHDAGSEYGNTSCQLYTGRFHVLSFDGKEFVSEGTDGAWWLNSDLRNYKRTISNKKTADGIEQIDLMPDGTYRRTFWKGAKTLDDLRKAPDELRNSKQRD